MSGKIVFDTNSAINLLNAIPISDTIAEQLDTSRRYISQITCIELFAYSKLAKDDEKDIRRFLKKVHITRINRKVEKETITLRRDKKLKLPDAIIAATAISLNAILISNDDRMLRLQWPGLKTMPLFNED